MIFTNNRQEDSKPLATQLHQRQEQQFDLTHYREAMLARHGRLKLEELDPTTHDVHADSMRLTNLFVPQSARECAGFVPTVLELPKELQRRLREAGEIDGLEIADQHIAHHRREYIGQVPRGILEVIAAPAHSRLVVLGEPGSGKSTLLQYLLLRWAEQAAPDPERDPPPILIELREYARLRQDGAVDGILAYIEGGTCLRWQLGVAELAAWLKAYPSLLLFDGLDEIFDPTLRRETATAIHRFGQEFPRSRIVVTSRTIAYQQKTWRDEGFRQCTAIGGMRPGMRFFACWRACWRCSSISPNLFRDGRRQRIGGRRHRHRARAGRQGLALDRHPERPDRV